ncbi:MAG: c-type cytochrome [Saprospiraceae bacterium]|nr:c-type cytochrome [Saprospiraceae bacterium]
MKGEDKNGTEEVTLFASIDPAGEQIAIHGLDSTIPLAIHHVQQDFRPYIHPIRSPDGQGVLTEYSPGHHKHQTGLYWGFTRINNRDYFHNPGKDYWRKVSAEVDVEKGKEIKWRIMYHLLGEGGQPVMEERQLWSMQQKKGRYYIALEWMSTALVDITIGEYDYGGLFLRMPWKKEIDGRVLNAARQQDEKAEGQRAMWIDVGMAIDGREDHGHVTLFDHPQNDRFPTAWRVDNQMGIGPAPARLGDINLKKGENKVIQYGMMVYTGEVPDVELAQEWKTYSGAKGRYSSAALWRIAQEEGREAKFLSPQEAVTAMTVAEGYQVDVWAAEPLITQPMAFCWDNKGRLWIAENRDYESRGHGFSNSGDSRILILEDTDNDGQADQRKVFAEGIPFPAALAVGFDGVFVGAPPNLLFIPDKDGDDRADIEDIEIRLTGWGIRDRHETLNSFHWGPDGWLYGCQGFATPSVVRKPEGGGRIFKPGEAFPKDLLEAAGVEINGGVWRYHPTKELFEVVAHGFSNPWGIDYDAHGQLFITACVIPHLWYVIPGGIYHRQGGRHFNPYVYQDIKTITDHSHRSAHGGARFYLSDAFSSEQYGRLFMANIHEHAVLSDVIEPARSGFRGKHGADFLMANNAQWVGFSMELGPDGNLYVLDWHDADICGKEVLHKETGRVFKISPAASAAKEWEGRYDDMDGFSGKQLIELQLDRSSWHARRARLILQKRASEGKLGAEVESLARTILNNETHPVDIRLRSLWTLYVTELLSGQDLLEALHDREPYVRGWAVQLATQDSSLTDEMKRSIGKMAQDGEPSPVVRLYLASAMQRLPAEVTWEIAESLVTTDQDEEDHNIPKMIWYGIEPLVEQDSDRAMRLANLSRLSIISAHISRRLTDVGKYDAVLSGLKESSEGQYHILVGLRDGLKGNEDVNFGKAWTTVYQRLSSADDPSAGVILEIAQLLGDQAAAKTYLQHIEDWGLDVKKRRTALMGLAQQRNPALIKLLPGLIEESSLKKEAIRAVASFDDKSLGTLLLDHYSSCSDELKMEVLQTLSSRPSYGGLLTQAIKNGDIRKREVPAYVARQLRRVVGSGFVEVWGPIDESIQGLNALYDHYRVLLTPTAIQNADYQLGRRLFDRSCGTCHQMHGYGGTLGPDITGSNRLNTEYLLGNILEPSSEIQDDYQMVVLTTQDGRTYTGTIKNETETELTLAVVGSSSVVLPKSQVLSREVNAISMMPQGLLQTFTNEETLALFKYLQTEEMPKL